MQDRWESLVNEHVTLESLLSDPEVLSDQKRLREVSRRYKELTPVVECIRTIESRRSDGDAARELLTMTDSDAEKEQLKLERDSSLADVARLEDELRTLLLPKDPNDGRPVILEIRGAEGGRRPIFLLAISMKCTWPIPGVKVGKQKRSPWIQAI